MSQKQIEIATKACLRLAPSLSFHSDLFPAGLVMTLRPRGAMRPSCAGRFALPNNEGAGNAGRWPHPWPACEKSAGGRNHRFSRDIPAFPARWLGGLYVLSPGTGCLAPVTDGSSSPSAWPQHREARTLRFRRRIGLVRPHDQVTLRDLRAHRIPPRVSWRSRYAPR